MWYNLSLDGINFRPGYLHKLGVYTEYVTVPKKISSDVSFEFKKSPASIYGITRSFFLDKKTYNLLHVIYNKSQELYKTLYGDYLSLGNFTELILYIYITENIEKKILDVFKFDFGIKKIT